MKWRQFLRVLPKHAMSCSTFSKFPKSTFCLLIQSQWLMPKLARISLRTRGIVVKVTVRIGQSSHVFFKNIIWRKKRRNMITLVFLSTSSLKSRHWMMDRKVVSFYCEIWLNSKFLATFEFYGLKIVFATKIWLFFEIFSWRVKFCQIFWVFWFVYLP